MVDLVAAEAEKALIGSCLYGLKYLRQAHASGVRVEMFSLPAHRAIWRLLDQAAVFDTEVDLVWIRRQLEITGRLGEVGEVYLVHLAEFVPSPANVRHYAHLVMEAYRLRTIAETCDDVARRVREGLDKPEPILRDMLDGLRTAEPPRHISEWESGRSAVGRTTGNPLIDRVTGFGLPCGQMTLVSGATKAGKSALLVQLAIGGLLEDRGPTLWYSLADLPPEILRARIERAFPAAPIDDIPLYVYTSRQALSVERMASQITASADTLGVHRVVVDYAQKVRTEESNIPAIEQAARCSAALCEAAERTGVALVVASQITETDDGLHITKGARVWQEDAGLEIVVRRGFGSDARITCMEGRFSAAREFQAVFDRERLMFEVRG